MPVQEHLDIPRRRPPGAMIAAAAAAILILAAAAAGVAFVLRTGDVVAPDLRGLTLQKAADAAQAADVGLLARGDTETATALVMSQDPAPETEMRSGAVVRVTLAAPPALVTVPDARGLTTERARALLAASQLRPGALREDAEAAGPQGVVTRQEPAPGTELPAGASVSLWVTGAATVALPELSGLTREEAEAAASAAGFSVRFLTEVTDEVLPGLVFEQSPRAGTRVAPGSQIVAIINGGSPGSGPGTSAGGGGETNAAAPAVFEALARSYSFPVLYPTFLPHGLQLLPAPDNPGHRTGPADTQGFVATYVAADDPGRTLSLLEGDWFDPGLEGPTTVDVRGLAADLEASGGAVVLVWTELGARYALSSTGIPQSDVLAVATGLRVAEPR